MSERTKMSRISLDVTDEQHRLIKARAALTGKTLKQLFLEAIEIPEQELWLYDPKNKQLVEEIKEVLKEKATIDLGSFKKYAEED